MPKPITKKQLADFWLANFLSNGLSTDWRTGTRIEDGAKAPVTLKEL